MFILTGSFDTEHQFDISKAWFNKYVYSAKRNLRYRINQDIKKLQKEKVKLYELTYNLKLEIKELQEIKNNLTIKKPSLREEYRRRMNKNV